MDEFKLLYADNVDMGNATVKAVYHDRTQAIQALHTEIALAKAEHGINDRIVRFINLGDCITVDFGSWSDFIGMTGLDMADLRAFLGN